MSGPPAMNVGLSSVASPLKPFLIMEEESIIVLGVAYPILNEALFHVALKLRKFRINDI